MDEPWTPVVEGTRLMLACHRDGERIVTVVGEVTSPVTQPMWTGLVHAMAPYHRDSGPGWMLRAAREAVTGLGGQVVSDEPLAVTVAGWAPLPDHPPPAPLDASWTEWLVESLLSGHPRSEIAQRVRDRFGVGIASALDALSDAPAVRAARRVTARASEHAQVLRLLRSRLADATVEIDEPQQFDADRFWHEAWAPHRPVVLRGVAADWPDWSPASLRQRFGDCTVEVMQGRTSPGPSWWKRRNELACEMRLGALLDHVEQGSGDDLYLVARNELSRRIEPLVDDAKLLPGLASRTPANIWIGPKGTITPLHHDRASGWLVQRYGTKRVWLASPVEVELLETADGVHNHAVPQAPPGPDNPEVHWHRLDLHAGDAVFIPAGWWHQVESLTASVSVTLTGFERDSTVPWYRKPR